MIKPVFTLSDWNRLDAWQGHFLSGTAVGAQSSPPRSCLFRWRTAPPQISSPPR